MPSARNQELVAQLVLRDQLSGPLAAAKQNVGAFDAASQRLDERLTSARSSISKTAAAGSQLALVAHSIGGAFGESIGPLGEFLRVAGNIGLVASTAAELGPAVAGAAKGVTALGAASTAATPGVAGLATAETAASAGAAGLGAALAPLSIVAVATAGAVGLNLPVLDLFHAAQDKAAAAAGVHIKSMSSLIDVQLHAAEATAKNDFATTTLTGSALQAAEAAEKHRLRLLGEETQIDKVKTAVQSLGTSLTNLPKNIDINVNLHLNSSSVAAAKADVKRLRGIGEDNSSVNQFGGPAVQPFEQTIPIIDPDVVAFNKSQADARLAAAKQRAQELAAAYRDQVSSAFDKARRTADTLFDALHDRHVKAIKDAENLADKQHTAALQNIADSLKAAQAADAAPVNAAEKALRDREQAQQRRDLVEAQQAAQQALQANTDPTAAADLQRSLRAATEALQNFDAQAAIDRLKVVQGGLDAQAQSVADKATADADAKLAAAKAQAQKDTDAETVAAQKRKKDFEVALAALEARDLKSHKTPAELQSDIAALEKKFGITTDALGFHHIQDPFITAIKSIKIEPPKVTTVVNNYFKVALNGREISAALSAGQSPTASGGVRQGGAGRG